MIDVFFVATELWCLELLRLNSMSRHSFSMSQQSLIYSLSLAELFVATLNPLLRQTCLGSSHLSSSSVATKNFSVAIEISYLITTQIVLFHTLKSTGFEPFLRSNKPN